MTRDEFNNLLEKANLTKKDFCTLLNIAYPTVNNWGSSKDIPYWVKSWLENYIKAKDIEKMAETMRPYIKCDEK